MADDEQGDTPATRPRVLHVLEAVGGGTLRHLMDVVQSVTGVDHHIVVPPESHLDEAHIPVANGATVADLVGAGAVIHHVRLPRRPFSPANVTAVMRLRRLIRRIRPSIVHGHSAVGGAFARVAPVGTSLPVVYTPHGLATSRSILAVERVLAPLTTRFVAVSAGEGDRLRSLGLTGSDRLVVIPNGIDVDRPPSTGDFDLRAHLQLPAGVALVGTVIRLVAQKAPLDFVSICEAVHRRDASVHFVLVGAGALEAQVDAAIGRAGLAGCFHRIRHLPNASTVVAQLDVFVLASNFEGAPYTPLEAIASGVPVVLSDAVGNADIIEHRRSGLLFPVGACAAMAEGVLELLDDRSLRDTLTSAAAIRVKEHFDVRAMSARLDGLYRVLT